MLRYVALLRGINVAGHKVVSMEDLRAHFAMPGIEKHSLLIYRAVMYYLTVTRQMKTLLHQQITTQLEHKLGYKVPVVIRMIHELKKVIKNNPFGDIKTEEKSRLYVTFLSEVPPFDVRGSLGVYCNDAEYARVVNREVYIYSPNYGKTCFSNTFIEKKLRVAATTRNWATINKIVEL
jgi:uncharacterized protein (DUF1697 family)